MDRSLVAVVLLALVPGPVAAASACDRDRYTTSIVETAPGIEIFVRAGGRGEPAVIIPGDFLLFDGLCPLAENHRVVFYDMRNRGRSASVAEGEALSLEADVHDLESIRRHFGLERPAVVGYSYLGKMVVAWAREHPGHVARLVQLGAVPMDPGRTFPPALAEPSLTAEGDLGEEIRRLRQLRGEGLHTRDPEAYCRLEWSVSRRGLVGDPAHAAALPDRCALPNEWPVRLAFHMEHHDLGSMIHAVITPADLASLEVPVLTVHGTRDRNAPYGGGREWAASLPHARLLTLEGVGHASHVEVDLLPILEEFLAGSWPDGAATVEAAVDGQRSQLQAWDLLNEALLVHAPDGVPKESALRVVWRGELRTRSQGRRPQPPLEPAFPVEWEAVLAPDRSRIVLDEELAWPSFVARVRSVVTPEDAFDLDLGSGAVSPPFREPRELTARLIRMLPPLLLDEVLSQEAASLRFAGVVRLDGEVVHAVSAVHRGEHLDLFLDERGLLGYARMLDEPMLGDAAETIRFRGTREGAGLRLPEWTTRRLEAFGETSRLELVTAGWETVGPALFERPLPAPGSGPGAPEEVERPAADVVEALAPGVALVAVSGQPDYKSLVIERADHLVLVEAPRDEGAGRELVELLAARFPGKPIRWLIATHHHFDHSGGVPAVVAHGAGLVTTPGNAGFFRRATVGPHTLRGRREQPRAPEIHTVADRWSIPGGPPSVEVLRVDAADHAAEMLAVHLPDTGILFQGDLVRFPLDPGEVLRPQVCSLWRLLAEDGLQVTRIAGVHGEVGTPRQIAERLAADDASACRYAVRQEER